ncbi:TAXI family TRAP transporter solute-binding subunit [Sciscionella marina]|uniref:TAXI family TRAP transporter solute-binding subunit n=1 Tax=Sciscionella marina TaxID=508770 RepID=UPI00037FA021|nr:TAXI family TRAP transporter solute-binding subunit [Sciscionella marina]
MSGGGPLGRRALLLGTAAMLGAAAGCGSRFADTRLRFAVGPEGGLWARFAALLAEQWRRRLDLPAPAMLRSPGAYPSVRLLASGRTDLAMQSSDLLEQARRDRVRFAEQPLALGRMYSDVAQVFVPAEAPYRRLTDLRGKRVCTAIPNQRPIPVTARALAAAGLVDGESFTAVSLPLRQVLDALFSGEIDALCAVDGLPLPAAEQAGMRHPLRVLDLGDITERLLSGPSLYQPFTVPAGTYGPGQPRVESVQVPNYLLASKRMPDELAIALLDALFEGRSAITTQMPMAAALDKTTAVDTGTVPLHPGAVSYYRSAKG